jgi:hypothetical protein
MILRFEITLAAKGAKTSVFTSRRAAVSVKLQAKTPERIAVIATPLPGFDPCKDFLVTETVGADGQTTRKLLHGNLSDNVLNGGQLSSTGELIANSVKFVSGNVTRFI